MALKGTHTPPPPFPCFHTPLKGTHSRIKRQEKCALETDLEDTTRVLGNLPFDFFAGAESFFLH